MDPDAALANLREQAEDYQDSEHNSDLGKAAAAEMAEQFAALDDWLSNGGFPPAAWRA